MRLVVICTVFLVFNLSFLFLGGDKVLAATDPIAHWKFDDGSGTSPDDSSTNNITAAFTSTNPTWTTDVPSAITFSDPYSLDFTGNGDGVTVSWPADLDFAATDPRSFSFWYKPTANGEGQYSRILSWSNDRLEIAGTSGGGTNHKIAYFDGNWNDTNITLTLGQWYFVTFTYDGTTARFYIGNELQDEHSLAGRALSGTLRIGNRVQQLDEGINGKIDDVRIYDYALNSTQVSNLSSGADDPDGDPTPIPTSVPQNNTNIKSSAQASCTDKYIQSSPNLFQINASQTTAKLYFSPIPNTSSYRISYGVGEGSNQHSVSLHSGPSTGVLSYSVNSLNTKTKYSFTVQAENCAGIGPNSNVMMIETGSDQIFYKDFIRKVISKLKNQKSTQLVAISNLEKAALGKNLKKNNSLQKNIKVKVSPKKKCMLFICW